MQAPSLTLRVANGAPLSFSQGDDNLQKLLDYITGVSALVESVVRSDGVLRLYAEDTGDVNQLAITPEGYVTEYVAGMVFFIKVANTNTDRAYLKVASGPGTYLDPVEIFKDKGVSLAGEDLEEGHIYALVYADEQFNLVAGSGTVTQTTTDDGTGSGTDTGSGTSSTADNSSFTGYHPVSQAIPAYGAALSLTPNFLGVPTQVVVRLVCENAAGDAGYPFHAQVDISDFTSGDGATLGQPAFVVSWGESTGIKVTRVANVIQLAGAAINVAIWTMKVIAYQWTSDNRFTGDAQNLISTGTGQLTWKHGFSNTVPIAQAVMMCMADDAGWHAGDILPLSAFYDANKRPALILQVTSESIIVNQTLTAVGGGTAGVKVSKPDGTGPVDITGANWQLMVYAFDTYQPVPAYIEKAEEMSVVQPEAAMGYGDSTLIFHTGNWTNKTQLSKYDRTTNNIMRLSALGSKPYLAAKLTKLKVSSGKTILAWSSNKGLHSLNMDTWDNYIDYCGLDLHPYRPVWWSEASGTDLGTAFGGTTSHPEVYLLTSQGQTSYKTNALRMMKLAYGTSYALSDFCTINLHDTHIQHSDLFNAMCPSGSPGHVFSAQYNPIKKRLYVWLGEVGFLAIFNLSLLASTANIAAWAKQADATRYPQLTFEKFIALPGIGNSTVTDIGGSGLNLMDREQLTVEWDIENGAEKSMCMTRLDNKNNWLGTVVRMPWRE